MTPYQIKSMIPDEAVEKAARAIQAEMMGPLMNEPAQRIARAALAAGIAGWPGMDTGTADIDNESRDCIILPLPEVKA